MSSNPGAWRRRLTSLLMAGAVWGPEERVTTTTTDSETGLNHRTMAVDGNGRLHVVWAEQNGPRGNYQVMTRERSTGGAWGAPALVVPFRPEGIGNLLGAKFPALVAGPGDSLHLVWHDYRHGGILNCEIYGKSAAAGAAWDTSAATEIRLTTTNHPESNGDNGYVPAFGIDRSGACHLAWYDFRYDGSAAEILTKSRVDGGWDTTPGDLADANISMTAGDSQFPDLAVDGRGGLHVVWQDDTAGNWRVMYAHRPTGAAFFDAPLAITTHDLAATVPVVTVNGPGRATVAWVDAREGIRRIYARHRESDGTWTPERPASPAGFSADEPALAVDEYGRTWLAWHDTRYGSTNREIIIQCAAAGADFDSTGTGDVRVSAGAGASTRPTLLAPGDGTIHVLYRDRRDANQEVYHRQGTLSVPVGVPDGSPGSAVRLVAWPNPVRGVTTLAWVDGGGGVGSDAPVLLDLLDTAGRRRATLSLSGEAPHEWRPMDNAGRQLPAGNYWLRPRDGRAPALRLVVVR